MDRKIEKIKTILYDWDRELSIKEQDLPPGERKTAEARRDLFLRLEQVLELEPDGPNLEP